MSNITHEIKDCIKSKLDEGFRKFIIFPYGEIGVQIKYILNTAFDIQESYLLDSRLGKYNPKIKPLEFVETLDCEKYCLIFATTSRDNASLLPNVRQYFPEKNIAVLHTMQGKLKTCFEKVPVGKYSYGPLCDYENQRCIQSIGAFCSFALGTAVVINHEFQYLATMIEEGADGKYVPPILAANVKFDCNAPEVQPIHEKVKRRKKSVIGNDVWLGHNVIITNYANIGNGVIAAAGAVITKDVPDYAVVAGVPARIIRYRYSPEQIEALNKICWWDWPDEKIRECHEDFYLPIEEFIQKHLNEQ